MRSCVSEPNRRKWKGNSKTERPRTPPDGRSRTGHCVPSSQTHNRIYHGLPLPRYTGRQTDIVVGYCALHAT